MGKSTVFFATFGRCSICSQTQRTYRSIADLRCFGQKSRKCAQTTCTYGSIANFTCVQKLQKTSCFYSSQVHPQAGVPPADFWGIWLVMPDFWWLCLHAWHSRLEKWAFAGVFSREHLGTDVSAHSQPLERWDDVHDT